MSKPTLTAEQQQLVQQKEFSLNRPIDELIGILGPIAQWDAAGDTSRRNLGCTGAAALVLGIAGLFFVGWYSIALIAAGIVLLVMWNKKKAEDISDNLRKCALPMLVALREDFGDEPVELKLDLRPPLSPAKQAGVEKVNKVTLTTYNDAWMYGEGILQDGCRLRWNVNETIVEKKYWKRGSSGKSKLKTKTKKRVEIEADLTLKAKTYGEKQTLHGEVKVKRAGIDPITPDDVISVIADLYAKAQPAAS
jgi:hypothetical protein